MLKLIRRLFRQRVTPLRAQAIAAGCVLLATLFRLALITPFIGSGLPLVTFSPAVLVASVWAGPIAGFSATLLSSLIGAGLFFDPSVAANNEAWKRLVAYWLFCGALVAFGATVHRLGRDLAESEERAGLLAREMSHRVRNVLALVQAISRQTAGSAHDLRDFQAIFEARLFALGRAQELIAANPVLPSDLGELLKHVLEPFGLPRLELSGDPAPVLNDIALTLALLIYELGTNSLKYGALSVPAGKVLIDWKSQKGIVNLAWREAGGPEVQGRLIKSG